MSRLRVLPPAGDAFDSELTGDEIVIGRSSECDLTIADRYLSRKHAKLVRDGERWLLEDLGSRNGTSLNGSPIDEPAEIRPGDEIQLSGSLIKVRSEEAPSHSSALSEHTIFRPASDLIDSQATASSSVEAQPADVNERLSLLNDLHQALSRPIELDELLDLILARAFEHLKPEEGSVFLKGSDGRYRRAAFRSSAGDQEEYLYSETLIDEVAEKGMAALVLDVADDARFAEAQSIRASGVRSLVAAPLLDPEGSLGMIALSSRLHRRQFSEADMELLVSVASIAALRIRNVALAAEAAERQRMQLELKKARRIQEALLPTEVPEVRGFELHGGNIPFSGVSGDFYQVTERGGGEECILMLADVSGKGMDASLLTASLSALSAGPIEIGQPPDEIFSMVSRQLHSRTTPEKFATAFLAVLESATGKLVYASAGHNPTLLVRASGDVDLLNPTGMPIGLMPAAVYTREETEMGPGDLLVIYTDGFSEAANPDGEEYGLERLSGLCSSQRSLGLEELAAAIEEDLERFAAGEPFADDRTLVMARRLDT